MDLFFANAPALLFYLFAAIAVVSAVLVVTLRNPMYSAMALLGSFLAVAALFLLRGAEFLAIVQVFVYGGGIMVLFLFVIMLVNLHRLHEVKRYLPDAGLALAVAVVLAALLGFALVQVEWAPAAGTAPTPELGGNSQAVAWRLYREYLLPFEIASVFLLVAMIGAVVMGKRR
jgi:NADH-quinone oxidoreductase subunit J